MMDYDILYRFFAKESSPEETDFLELWLKEDPEHEKEFNKAFELFMLTHMSTDVPAEEAVSLRQTPYAGTTAATEAFRAISGNPYAAELSGNGHKTSGPEHKRRRLIGRIVSYTAAVAASLAAGMFINSHFFTRPALEIIDSTTLLSEAMPGQRTSVVLSDGTTVELNSGSRIEYPAIFRKGERRIRLEGEAMFDVTHDPEHPFVVETFAYDVKVLGTKFDVIADSGKNEFTTALIEGKVRIQDKDANPLITLSPNMVATLENGNLLTSYLGDHDDYLWTDGIISASGIPFDKLMKRFERCYGHSIVIRREEMPQIRFAYLKFRISDGIEHALDLLCKGGTFKYSYDESSNTYYIN
ncbi:MAG: FecR domain-containing protein [Bacteroidales bacterium]|nr:FecR domain-containing protein [Bacteroidales bacterium]